MNALELLSNGEFWLAVGAILIAVHGLVVAVRVFLEKFDAVIPGDQKPIVKALKGFSGIIQKVLDIFSMNKKAD